MSKLVFGCGYLGSRVARHWREAGQSVHVVTRSAERARSLVQQGYSPLVADVVRPASLLNLPVADTVLYAVGFDRTAGVSMRDVFVNGLGNVLDALPNETGRFIYISSTGVYGQTDGERVDEGSPCQPQREGGRACLAAEEVLRAHRFHDRTVILRMAGLYGPGRIPHAAELRGGQPVSAPSEGCLNLIHIDDAAQVVLAAAERAAPPRLYVVSDGHPAERRTYFEELARALGGPAPRFAPVPSDSPAALRAASDKRVDNRRMTSELGVKLKYPTYREGLAAESAENADPSA